MNAGALKAEIKAYGLTVAQVAGKLGISESTMYRKLRTGDFTLLEAEMLINLLNIWEPEKIFFSEAAEQEARHGP